MFKTVNIIQIYLEHFANKQIYLRGYIVMKRNRNIYLSTNILEYSNIRAHPWLLATFGYYCMFYSTFCGNFWGTFVFLVISWYFLVYMSTKGYLLVLFGTNGFFWVLFNTFSFLFCILYYFLVFFGIKTFDGWWIIEIWWWTFWGLSENWDSMLK